MKIGILQTGRVTDPLREIHDDFPDMMTGLLHDGDFTFQTFAVLDGAFPNSVTECDGWLLTGSKYSAYDDLPWIATLETFLRGAYAADMPIVGICFGHQILAQALGGKVEKFPLGWAIGPTIYDFAGGEKMVINAWHQDQVTRVPPGATRIATSEFCENAALAYGNRALTYQAHPEFTNAFGRDLLDLRRDILPQETIHAADQAYDTLSPSDHVAQQIVQFFRHRAIRPKIMP